MNKLFSIAKRPEGGLNSRALCLYACTSVALICLLNLASCNMKQPAAQAESPKHIDSVTVYCDEAFKFLIDQEVAIYEFDQPDQHIHMVYTTEAEVLNRLYTDSLTDAILGRSLRPKEREEIYHKTNLQVNEQIFATDAIAILANRALDRDTLPYSLLLSLLNNSSHEYDLVFEGNGSGAINYMFAQIARTSAKPSAYAAKNMDDLADYIRKDKKGIGFIPFARISDEYDTAARHLLKKVKLLYVSRADSTGKLISSTASQSEIADGSYPLDRPINYVSHSMDERVSTGFVNFLHKGRSGRIILKSGLVPIYMPERLINVNTDGLK